MGKIAFKKSFFMLIGILVVLVVIGIIFLSMSKSYFSRNTSKNSMEKSGGSLYSTDVGAFNKAKAQIKSVNKKTQEQNRQLNDILQ